MQPTTNVAALATRVATAMTTVTALRPATSSLHIASMDVGLLPGWSAVHLLVVATNQTEPAVGQSCHREIDKDVQWVQECAFG